MSICIVDGPLSTVHRKENMAFKFEKLEVWKKALDLADKIHDLTKSYPKEELYVLTSQTRRASDSIVLNIAEGSTGQTNAEFKLFLGYAIRSAMELITCLYLANRRKLLVKQQFNDLYASIENIVKMLQSLRKYLKT